MITKARMLKVEADGDPYKGPLKPKIRISGHWLGRAGFSPGGRVEVNSAKRGELLLLFKDGTTK